jgi:hypothetical protein
LEQLREYFHAHPQGNESAHASICSLSEDAFLLM